MRSKKNRLVNGRGHKTVNRHSGIICCACPCIIECEHPLPLLLGEVAERSEDGEGKQGCKTLSVTCGDTLPKGEPRGCTPPPSNIRKMERICTDTLHSLFYDYPSNRQGRFLRVYLKTVNTPKQRVFSVCCAPFSLAIHKVFLRKNRFIRRKIPRCWSYFRFSDRP